jgi:hypothetical protein
MFLAALAALSYRHSVEHSNRAVGMLLEMKAVHELSVAEGMTREDALSRLKTSGLTGIALNEERLNDLVQSGRLKLDGNRLTAADKSTYDRLQFAVALRGVQPVEWTPNAVVIPPADVALLLETPCGINPDDAALARAKGLEIVARHANMPGYSSGDIRAVIADSADKGARYYLPLGDQVLGQRSAVESLVQALIDHDMFYLTIEFSNLAGDRRVVSEIPGRTIRLHSIQQAEIDRLTPGGIKERFVKAFAERNIRWLLLRPPTLAGENPMQDLGATMQVIARGVANEKGAVRAPRAFAEPVVNPAFPAAATLLGGIALIGVILVAPFPGRWRVGLAVVVGLVSVAAMLGVSKGYFALMVAVAAPVVAYALLRGREDENPLWAFARTTLICVSAGLMVATTLNGLPYYIQLQQFSGVKIAHFLPLIVIAIWFIHDRYNLKELAKEPMRWGPVLGSMAGGFVVLFMLSRTGNDGPVGVSGVELMVRSALESVLPVRPRTKEFLIGHPLLLLGLLWRHRTQGQGKLAPEIMILAGFIGQASIINTFCHLHTPLQVTVIRVTVGLVLGVVGALAAWVALRPFIRQEAQ